MFQKVVSFLSLVIKISSFKSAPESMFPEDRNKTSFWNFVFYENQDGGWSPRNVSIVIYFCQKHFLIVLWYGVANLKGFYDFMVFQYLIHLVWNMVGGGQRVVVKSYLGNKVPSCTCVSKGGRTFLNRLFLCKF